MTTNTLAPADVETYCDVWYLTVKAVRLAGRLGKWSSRIGEDNDPHSLRGVITVYGKHKRVQQAIEVIVLPHEVHAVLWDTSTDDWKKLDETEPLKRGELVRLLRESVNEWRRVAQLTQLVLR